VDQNNALGGVGVGGNEVAKRANKRTSHQNHYIRFGASIECQGLMIDHWEGPYDTVHCDASAQAKIGINRGFQYSVNLQAS
jgi:hypothetical protein